MPTGAASAGLCRDSPVRKLVRAASRTRMDTDTQRVLLALEKEALKWDAHADTKLYLGRTGKHRALQCFFKTCNSSHPTPKSLKANEIPQTFSQVTGYYCFGSCAGGASVLGLKHGQGSKFLISCPSSPVHPCSLYLTLLLKRIHKSCLARAARNLACRKH